MRKTPKEYAMNLLRVRDRTEGEIRQKMKLKGYFLEEVEDTLKFLKDKKFIDDARFLENYVSSQRRQGQAGRYKIRCRLKGLSLNGELIDRAIEEISDDDELETAKNLANQWLAKSKNKEQSSEKLGRFLMGRGFDYGVVLKVINSIS